MTASPVTLQRQDDIGVLVIDNPPVNALSPATVQGLIDGLAAFEADDALRGLVLIGAGRTFVAGGDIASFEDPDFSATPFNDFLARLEGQSRPVVAALHGTPLGGGLELAMACHWRMATPDTRVGLPEVKLGLLPGSLGTQRLPRLVGAALALDMMRTGRMVDAAEAYSAGVLDEVVEPPLREAAIARALAMAAADEPLRRASELIVDSSEVESEVLVEAQAWVVARPQYPAQAAIARAVRAAIALPFADGAALEAREFAQLLRSPQSVAMRHLFFAERAAGKIPGLPRDITLRPVTRVGVIGAGTMGSGIAMTLLNAGLPVVLVEADADALARGLGVVQATYGAAVAKGRLSPEGRDERLGRLSSSLVLEDLAEVDLVIEAVYEDLALKCDIAARLGRILKPGAILATNTSTLDVDRIAQASGRPADVLGMHFFSPAHIMRLLEVVRGAQTEPAVLATVMKLAARLGKVAVVSGVCYGFIGNRMAEVYMREAEFLLMEGATPEQVDGAVQALGMAMGPCRMLDMAGIDVGAKTVIELGKAGGLPDDPSYRAVVQALYARGQYGQKTGAGYYRYEGRTPLPNLETAALIKALAAQHGIAQRDDISDTEIVERLLYPMINEGARILEEGIAYRGSDIDVVWTAGYGFPDFLGGPLCYADQIGLQHVVERLTAYGHERGNPYGYWDISPRLATLAAEGGRLSLAG